MVALQQPVEPPADGQLEPPEQHVGGPVGEARRGAVTGARLDAGAGGGRVEQESGMSGTGRGPVLLQSTAAHACCCGP